MTTNDTEDQPVRIEPKGKRGGKWVVLGMEQYRIPALAFGAVSELQDDVEALRDMNGRPKPEHMHIVAKIVHAAMVRNYPDITVEQVGDMLDLGNYSDVLSAVLNISGFTKGPSQSGEPVASTGAPSTSH